MLPTTSSLMTTALMLPTATPLTAPSRPKEIVILGGGISGLSAATTLLRRSPPHTVSVQILEARNRLGGRIHTQHFEDGSVLERGAAWIHGVEENSVTDLAKDIGVELYPTFLEDVVLYEETRHEQADNSTCRARRIPKRAFRRALATWNEQDSSLSDFAEELEGGGSEDLSIADGLERLVYAEEKETKGGDASDEELRNRITRWLWRREEIDCGAPLCRLSLRAWQASPYDHDKGGEALLLDGYGSIVDALARQLPDGCLRMSAVVKEVRLCEGVDLRDRARDSADEDLPVVVLLEDGTEVNCDAVICTIPLGCLRAHDVTFVPSTAALRAKGCIENENGTKDREGRNAQVEVGLLNWVILKFAEPFWQQEERGGDRTDDSDYIGWLPERIQIRSEPPRQIPTLVPLEYTNLHEQRHGTLAVQVAGEAAWSMEQLNDQDIANFCMEPLRAIYGDRCFEPQEIIVTRWGEERFSKGAYSMLPVGCTSVSAHSKLAKPAWGRWGERLLFAGEATDRRHPGTVQGAFDSGTREAKRLLASYGLEPM